MQISEWDTNGSNRVHRFHCAVAHFATPCRVGNSCEDALVAYVLCWRMESANISDGRTSVVESNSQTSYLATDCLNSFECALNIVVDKVGSR